MALLVWTRDVASPCAVGEDRGLPDAVADRYPHPKGAEAASETGGQVTDVLGTLRRAG
jgi:hypothetical protein